jgi:hypothetical protein
MQEQSPQRELEVYKQNRIRELTNVYTINVGKINRELSNNIRSIQRRNIALRFKRMSINSLINSFNNRMKNLRNNFNNEIKEIRGLIDIPGRNPRKNAVLVGINYENTKNQLYGCINDVNNLKTFLQREKQWSYFTSLTDKSFLKPTRKNILTEFSRLLQTSIPGDVLFFSYSGHGTFTKDLNNDELDGQDEVIVPIDLKMIIDDELNKIIIDNLKTGVSLFCLFDCCFSGTVLDLKYNYFDSDYSNENTVNPNVSETNGNVLMISGCMDSQTSMDAGFITQEGLIKFSGAMTTSFLNEVSQNGYEKSISQVLEGMRKFLKENSFVQVPQVSTGKLTSMDTKIYDYFDVNNSEKKSVHFDV